MELYNKVVKPISLALSGDDLKVSITMEKRQSSHSVATTADSNSVDPFLVHNDRALS